MKYSEIKKMKDAELANFIKEKKEARRGFRFNSTAGDVKTLRTAKTEIARALTELSARGRDSETATTDNVE